MSIRINNQIYNNIINYMIECIEIYIETYNEFLLLFSNKQKLYSEIFVFENDLYNYYNNSNYINKNNFFKVILNNIIYMRKNEINKINNYMEKYLIILNNIYLEFIKLNQKKLFIENKKIKHIY